MTKSRGFTLLELIIALVLLGLLSAVLFGSLKLAGRSTASGEAKVDASSSMRLAEEFLRTNLAQQFPLRMRKIVQFPLLFAGQSNELRYAAPLPPRVAGGGVWYYRLAVRTDEAKSPLVLERVIPDTSAMSLPTFDGTANTDGANGGNGSGQVDRSVLADGIASLTLAYYGRDPGDAATVEPTWRDHWDDTQRLPLLIRVDVAPQQGSAWPTLYVTPREAPEAGCRAWDDVRGQCAAV